MDWRNRGRRPAGRELEGADKRAGVEAVRTELDRLTSRQRLQAGRQVGGAGHAGPVHQVRDDADTAGQVSGSTKRFIEVSGYSEIWHVLDGYAVLANASMPVVGDNPDVVNNSYVSQIVANAKGWVKDYFSGPRGRAAGRGAAGG